MRSRAPLDWVKLDRLLDAVAADVSLRAALVIEQRNGFFRVLDGNHRLAVSARAWCCCHAGDSATMRATTYDLAANRYRPTDSAQLAAEIQRLHENGLTARDIAAALRLAPDVVVAMLCNNHGDSRHVISN
jgi:hypothetical protein